MAYWPRRAQQRRGRKQLRRVARFVRLGTSPINTPADAALVTATPSVAEPILIPIPGDWDKRHADWDSTGEGKLPVKFFLAARPGFAENGGTPPSGLCHLKVHPAKRLEQFAADYRIAAITVSQVPAPPAVVLVGIGLGVTAAGRRFRRRA